MDWTGLVLGRSYRRVREVSAFPGSTLQPTLCKCVLVFLPSHYLDDFYSEMKSVEAGELVRL